MKKMFFSNWTMFCIVFTLIFNNSLSSVEGGEQTKKKPFAKLFGPKTPSIDEIAARKPSQACSSTNSRCHPAVCKPRVVPIERIVYKEVVKEVEIPVYKTVEKEIPVEVPVYVSKPKEIFVEIPVYKTVEKEIPVEVPVYVSRSKEIPVDVPVYVSRSREIPVDVPVYVTRQREIPVEVPVVRHVVQRPVCPPGTYPVLLNENQHVSNHVVRQEPVVHQRIVRSAPVHYQEPCNDGFFGGGHRQHVNQGGHGGYGGQQYQPSGGGNYDRAMAWGHHVVNNAYNIGYGIGN
jgi:hypothetical protein